MSKYSGIAHYQDFNELVKLLGQSNSTYDIDKITKAYKFAEKVSWRPKKSVRHSLYSAPDFRCLYSCRLGMDTDAICAALLHDVVEDTPTTLEEVENFRCDVARLIDGVTRIQNRFSSREQDRQKHQKNAYCNGKRHQSNYY